MAKASKKSPEGKLRVVLSVLRGELSAAAAGRWAGVSEQTVHNWKKAFLEGGRDRLALGARRRSTRELELEAECEELKAALGEAHVRVAGVAEGGGVSPSFEDLEMIRTEFGYTVSRFAELVGCCGAPTTPAWRATAPARRRRVRGRRRRWTASNRRSPSSPPNTRRGGTARSGRWAATTAGTWRRRRACAAPWRGAACCNPCATRPNAASSPRRAEKCS